MDKKRTERCPSPWILQNEKVSSLKKINKLINGDTEKFEAKQVLYVEAVLDTDSEENR